MSKGFFIVAEEYKVHAGNCDFYIDLLFYHRTLQCLSAIELKAAHVANAYGGTSDLQSLVSRSRADMAGNTGYSHGKEKLKITPEKNEKRQQPLF
ncbi:PDDEXK nuclease domain-containing protein [Chitinophaga sp. OAE865]|uniref:PDDEXK nuclease domain-containing protein n=1 Tax=Chitinophaga sp. OAE865 TaxID=2817898 RepID=UPI001AE2B3E7